MIGCSCEKLASENIAVKKFTRYKCVKKDFNFYLTWYFYRILQNPCNMLQPRLPYMEVNYTD